jgi:hypothetical protein
MKKLLHTYKTVAYIPKYLLNFNCDLQGESSKNLRNFVNKKNKNNFSLEIWASYRLDP